MQTPGAVTLEPLRNAFVPERPSASNAASCLLPPRFHAVKDARRFTRETLGHWDLAQLLDSVELVASELVTNALRYGAPPDGGDRPVRLSLVRWSTRVVCAVRDANAHGPVPKAPDWVAESGRGLHLVENVSDTWGWHPLAGAGKVVWALFRVSGPGCEHFASP